jgi:hypothetical protein
MSMPTQCTHIRLNGFRCGSVAMRGLHLCYFHARMRRRAKANVDAAFPQVLLLEDAESIQATLMQLVDMLLADQIEVAKARVIISALTLASRNVKNLSIDDASQVGNNDFDRDRARATPPKEEPESEHPTTRLPEPVLTTAEEMAKWDRRPCAVRTKCHYQEKVIGNGLGTGELRDAFQTILTADANLKANAKTLAREHLEAAWGPTKENAPKEDAVPENTPHAADPRSQDASGPASQYEASNP